MAAHVGLQWSLNVVPDQVTFLNFQNLISLRNWFLLFVKASLVRRTCGSTRRYLTKDDVIGEITGPTVRWLSGIKKKNLNGCGKLTLASDLSDIADMTHLDLSNINHQLSRRPPVGVAGSIDVEHPLLVNLFVLAPRKSPRPPALNMPACCPRCHTVGANSRTRPVRETKLSRLHSMNTPRLSKVHVRTAAPSLPNLFALEWTVSTTIVATSWVTWLLVALHVTT